jgi:hypothetical protein
MLISQYNTNQEKCDQICKILEFGLFFEGPGMFFGKSNPKWQHLGLFFTFYIFTSLGSFKTWFVVGIFQIPNWYNVNFWTLKLSFGVDIWVFWAKQLFWQLFSEIGRFFQSSCHTDQELTVN